MINLPLVSTATTLVPNFGTPRSTRSLSSSTPTTTRPFGSEKLLTQNQTHVEPLSDSSGNSRIDVVAWLQVLGAFCLGFNTWGLLSAYGAFQTFYSLELLAHVPVSQISWIGSVQAFLLFLTSLFVGPAFDGGYLRPLLWIGSFLAVFGLFMTSLCTTFWQLLLAQGICMGLGFGCLFLPGPALISQHFKTRRNLAIGISSTGTGIGGVLFPVIFDQLQPRVGFGWATRVLAFIILAVSVPPLVIMRYPAGSLSGISKTRNLPTEGSPSSNTAFFSSVGLRRLAHKITDPSVLHDRPYNLLNVGLTTGYMGLYVVLYYIDLFAIDRVHSPPRIATNAVVILNAASVFGRIALSALADRLGPVQVMVLTATVSLICAFSLNAVHSTPGLIVWTVALGTYGGAFMGLPAAGIASISRGGVARIGARFGITLAIVGVGILIAEPIAGAILAGPGGWPGLIAWCGTLLAVGSISIAAARVAKVGWVFAAKL